MKKQSYFMRCEKMPLVPMRQILDEAAKKGYGVPHFNVNNMEQALA